MPQPLPSGPGQGRRAAPAWLMPLTIYLACIVIDPGQLGFDTNLRLQVTHWLWTSSDSLLDDDKSLPYEVNIAVGGDGRAHYGYGLGQSLAMLPGDVVGTALGSLARHVDGAPTDPQARIRRISVAYLTFPLIGMLTALVLRRFLVALGLEDGAAIAAVLLCFVSTRWFDVSQSYQETGLHLLMLLTGMACLLRWRATGRDRHVWCAGAAFAMLPVIRIVTLADIAIACAGFGILQLTEAGPPPWRRLFGLYARLAACVAVGIAIDRVYQFARFGDWTSTYAGLYFKHVADVRAHGAAPLVGAFNDPAFPWTTSLADSLPGYVVSPRWGLPWFDGMAVLALYLFARFFRFWGRIERIYMGTAIALLGVYALFYGRYFEPAGWAAWGNRYLEVPAILLSVLGVLLLFRSWSRHAVADRAIALAVCAASTVVQLASGFFYYGLESTQIARGCGSNWMIVQRLRNIATYLHGRMPDSDCVPANLQWMWDPYVFPAAIARATLKGATGRAVLWSLWAGALLVVLLLAGWLVAHWRQAARSLPARGVA